MFVKTIKNITKLCHIVNRRIETMHGNCGMFAWALAGFLGRRNCKIVALWDMVDEKGKIGEGAMCHVLVKYNGMYYDGDGSYGSEAEIIEAWEKHLYKTRSGWVRPVFWYYPASRDVYRLIKRETGWMVFPSAFEYQITVITEIEREKYDFSVLTNEAECDKVYA